MPFIPHSNDQESKASSDNIGSELQFTKDGRVEGSAVAFYLDPQKKFTDIVIGRGLGLSMSGIHETMKDHIMMLESRNQKKSLKGTICAIFPSPWSFAKLKPGPVPESSCLGLV